jgi:ABC-type lipoprotein release transport system permease subunit
MHRLLNILEYTLRAMARRFGKYLALVLVYMLVTAFFASVIFFTASLRKETQTVMQSVPDLWIQRLAGGRLVPLDTTFAASLQSIRGLEKIIPRVWGYYFDTPTGAVFTVVGSDTLTDGLQLLRTTISGPLGQGQAICGTGFLEMRGLDPGDRLTINDHLGNLMSFSIVGEFDAASDLLTRDLLIFSPDAARKILGLEPHEITDLALAVYNSEEVENIGRKINQEYSGIRVVTKSQLQTTYDALFSWRGGIFTYGALVSVFAFMILAWDRASGLSREEKKELGILKGIGWQIGDIMLMKFWEGFVVSALASLSGMLLAWIHVFVWQAPLIKPFLIGWSVVYPAYDLYPYIGVGDVLVVFFLATVPYLTATLFPAWKGAVTDPAEIMQN